MNNPFTFGRIAEKKRFCDREKETKRLSEYILFSCNICLYSPRRFGKTSLIKKILNAVDAKKIFTVFVDLYDAEEEKDFARIYAKSLCNELYKNKPFTEKIIESIKGMFQYIIPQITIDGSGKPVFQIGFSDNIKTDTLLEDIIDSVKRFSEKTGLKGVVVFDEFQQIKEFDSSKKIEKILRKHIQGHNNISYIFLGTKRHIMSSFLEDSNRTFHNSIIDFPVRKIPGNFLSKHIAGLFKKSGKTVDKHLVKILVERMESHPFYSEKLSFFCWLQYQEYKGNAENFIDSVVNDIILSEESNYKNTMSGLTKFQKRSLIAVAKKYEGEKIFTSIFVKKHKLSSLTQFKKSITSLTDKELIYNDDENIKLNDIFMSIWITGRENI